MSISTYQSLLSKYTNKTNSLDSQLRWLSVARLLLFASFIFFGYKAIQTKEVLFTILSAGSLIAFLILLRIYDRLEKNLSFYKALARLNRNEIDFLNGKSPVYDNGKEYTDPHHEYSYDLDLFGEGSLFHYLNRTSTEFGRKKLAKDLLDPDIKSINDRQQAIHELKENLEFRQHLQAYGMIQETKEKEMHQLKKWIDSPPALGNKLLYYVLFVFPLATISLLVYYFISENDNILHLFYGSFILNLVILGLFVKKIKMHLSVSTSVAKVLEQFSEQLKLIEAGSFESAPIKQLQKKLKSGSQTASQSITRLASLFNYLETFLNLVLSPLLNGFFLFHLHVLFALEKWKDQNGNQIMNWLQILGETEALNSFANLSFNNPSFCQPALSSNETLIADTMGHPLIPAEKRINNSISFEQQKFVILTGSNMSGKSTFLRTLGTNLILAKAGSGVCADKFIFYPYDVHVSMRINDSLQDSESFFYAELKRLQHIIEQLQKGNKTFIILDEILRGTNSNDKHNGTIGLIRKLVAAKSTGIIATHDLTVSKLADEFNGYISNKCFESEIINNELLFDFKLRNGVCTTLSASFLMHKMGIIDTGN